MRSRAAVSQPRPTGDALFLRMYTIIRYTLTRARAPLPPTSQHHRHPPPPPPAVVHPSCPPLGPPRRRRIRATARKCPTGTLGPPPPAGGRARFRNSTVRSVAGVGPPGWFDLQTRSRSCPPRRRPSHCCIVMASTSACMHDALRRCGSSPVLLAARLLLSRPPFLCLSVCLSGPRFAVSFS